jgi:uncharacterized surface protein with fasciclin (FAS1) repeats
VDYRSNDKNKECSSINSIMGYINNNPDFSIFSQIINKAMMNGKLSYPDSDLTILVPPNKYLTKDQSYYDNIDVGLARQILDSSTLNNRINGSLLRSSPVSYYITRDPKNRLYVTNTNGVTELNLSAKVLQFDIPVDNGTLHLIDSLLFPTYLN